MDSSNPGRAYGLAFIPHQKTSGGKHPEIELRFSSRHAELLYRAFEGHQAYLVKAATIYLSEPLALIWPDLRQGNFFGSTVSSVGYRACGYIVIDEDEWSIRLPLRQESVRETVLTVGVLLEFLAGIPSEDRVSNRLQVFTVQTGCARTGHTSHPVTGVAFPRARRWLASQKAGELPEEISAAMREAWCAVSIETHQDYAELCRATVSNDGRFFLGCFGDACDVAMYPDMAADSNPDHLCFFSCHNLDSPPQQLTLLAGLAALFERIESEQ